jgi:hypothetical protein
VTCNRLERDDLLGHLGEHMPHVDQCPDCRARLAGYQRLASLLARESDRPLPERWKERTLARVDGRRRRTRTAIGLAVAGACAAVVLLLVGIPGRPDDPAGLIVGIEPGQEQWRADPPPGPTAGRPGDSLKASVPAGDHTELRVYHEARTLVMRCPGSRKPGCQVGDRIEVRVPLLRGQYQVLWLRSSGPLPPPHAEGVEADSRSARKAGAQVTEADPIDVR